MQRVFLHGMFDDKSHEKEALLVQFQICSHPAMINARQSINFFRDTDESSKMSAVENQWNSGIYESQQMKRQKRYGMLNVIQSTKFHLPF